MDKTLLFTGAGKTAQQSGALVALTGVLGSVSSTHMATNMESATPVSGDTTSSYLRGHQVHRVHIILIVSAHCSPFIFLNFI